MRNLLKKTRVLKKIIFISLTLFPMLSCKSQNLIKGSTSSIIEFSQLYTGPVKTNVDIEEEIIKKSKSGNAYELMSLRNDLGGLNMLIERTASEDYINKQCLIINNIIQSSQVSSAIKGNRSYNDSYRGWIATETNKANQSSQFREVPLFESYSFFYITQFLYILRENGWVNQSEANQDWWKQTLAFIEKNEWEKWYERSYKAKRTHYWTFLRSRTHMGSHWAGVAMYLSKITSDSKIKEQCDKLQVDYDLLLKRNFKHNPKYPSTYIWNSTYDNTEGTDATEAKPSIIQDVSHGNHVVSYIVSAYEIGDKNWTIEDIHKLCNTFKKVIYNKENNTFADNVDGSADPGRPGWGHFIADGWSKLSKYDKEINTILIETINNKEVKKYNKGLQLKANVYLLPVIKYTK